MDDVAIEMAAIDYQFDFAPESCAEHAMQQALAQYAKYENWDHYNWIGPGDGPQIAQEAMK